MKCRTKTLREDRETYTYIILEIILMILKWDEWQCTWKVSVLCWALRGLSG